MRPLRTLLLLACALLPACNAVQPTGDVVTDRAGPGQTTLYVASYTRTCTGMYEMQCMLVKEHPEDEWSNFYDAIEGFTYEPGYSYTLLVDWREIPNPPADGSSRAYWLVRLVEKTRAP
jgi:hypothetical protein